MKWCILQPQPTGQFITCCSRTRTHILNIIYYIYYLEYKKNFINQLHFFLNKIPKISVSVQVCTVDNRQLTIQQKQNDIFFLSDLFFQKNIFDIYLDFPGATRSFHRVIVTMLTARFQGDWLPVRQYLQGWVYHSVTVVPQKCIMTGSSIFCDGHVWTSILASYHKMTLCQILPCGRLDKYIFDPKRQSQSPQKSLMLTVKCLNQRNSSITHTCTHKHAQNFDRVRIFWAYFIIKFSSYNIINKKAKKLFTFKI